MKPYHDDNGATIYNGDCREVLATLPDDSVDAVVTDPPYGLAFMGKRWDYDVPGVEVWEQCLRVLKPGGHLLAFAGTRTQHRMAANIEDAGFEIRDMIAWVYGSGFPKSLDVSKAIDKAAGVEGEYGAPKSAAHAGWIDRGRMRGEEGHDGYQRPWMANADAVGKNARQYIGGTVAARQWQGWGTALKPALEPITVARKPLCGTVAENVLTHGCGGINVDGCRVDAADAQEGRTRHGGGIVGNASSYELPDYRAPMPAGRWPANLIHDGSEEVTGMFPGEDGDESAARFFYTAKAAKSDRGHGNNHPTVKPVDLMRYLVRLVCPPDGVVLDPFAGSGTTIKAARLEGFRAIGVELSADYCDIAVERLRQRVLF